MVEGAVESFKKYPRELGAVAFSGLFVLTMILSSLMAPSVPSDLTDKINTLNKDVNSKTCIQMQKTIDAYNNSTNENAKAFAVTGYEAAVKYREEHCKD